MSWDFNGSNEWLEVTDAPTFTAPYSIQCWFNTPGASVGYAIDFVDASTTNNQTGLLIGVNATVDNAGSGSYVGAVSYGNTLFRCAKSGESYSNNVWNHVLGVYNSATSRDCYLNNGTSTNSGTSIVPANIDTTGVGSARDSSPGAYYTGMVAEIAVWNVALTAAERAVLAVGVSPRFVRPTALVCYYPLVRGLSGLVRGATLSANGSPSVAAHPPIIQLSPIQYGITVAAGGNLTINVSDSISAAQTLD